MAVVASAHGRVFLFSPCRAVRWYSDDFPAGGGTFLWVPHGLKTLRPKEEDTTQAQQEDNSTMKLFYTNEDLANLDAQIKDLENTLADVGARSTRLLEAMETDGLAVAGDVHV